MTIAIVVYVHAVCYSEREIQRLNLLPTLEKAIHVVRDIPRGGIVNIERELDRFPFAINKLVKKALGALYASAFFLVAA